MKHLDLVRITGQNIFKCTKLSAEANLDTIFRESRKILYAMLTEIFQESYLMRDFLEYKISC